MNTALRYVITFAALTVGILLAYYLWIEAAGPSISFFVIFGLPFLAGALIAAVNPKRPQSVAAFIIWQVIVMLGALALSRISGLEGVICIAMALAPFLLFSILGGVVWYVIHIWLEDTKSGLQAVILIPVLATFGLDQIPANEQVITVTNEIIIDAPAGELFEFVKSIDDISPQEIDTKFTHLLGVPKPTSATWVEDDISTKRISKWSEDITFHEMITSAIPAQQITWDFEFPDGWIVEGIEDPHVKIGGEYVDVVRGGYRFEAIENGTRVTLWTQTLDRSKMGWYARFWHKQFIGDFHTSILSLMKARIEA